MSDTMLQSDLETDYLFQMLERSIKMSRTEHREANHLEDDGGIREIIQSAQMIPISDSEQSNRGQMAPLDEPQQLWGRPGWSQFSGSSRNVNNDAKATKRSADEAELDVGVEQNQPVKTAVKRTLAFVDCQTPNRATRQAFEYIQDDESGEEDTPLIDRLRAASSSAASTLPAHTSLRIRSVDPCLPTMGCPVGSVASFGAPSQEARVSSSDVEGQAKTESTYQRVSISQLLNDDEDDGTPGNDHAVQQKNLLMEILRRL